MAEPTLAELVENLEAAETLVAGWPEWDTVDDQKLTLERVAEWGLELYRRGVATGGEGVLWCVQVQGPGSVIPQPDRETAERRAKEWNAMLAKVLARNPSPLDPVMHCEVIPWPWSAEGHAEGLAEHGGAPEDIC